MLAAYRASWSAFEQALADANPNAPALAATMVDPQLQSVKANLLADQQHGIVGRGHITLHPKSHGVVGYDGDGRGLCLQRGRAGLRSDRQTGPAGNASGERRGYRHPGRCPEGHGRYPSRR